MICPSRIDPYGFERPHDYEPYKEMMNDYVAVLNRRSVRWSKLLQEKPQVEKNLTGEGIQSALFFLGLLSLLNIIVKICFESEKVRA